jgi:CubicO group peptidase (beta-lactamase class C family)
MAQPAVTPEQLGFDATHLGHAYALVQRMVETGHVPAAALCVGRERGALAARFFGRQRPEADAPALRDDALFLVASITKPVTATALMMLVERGLLSLQDRVADFVPEFGCNGKEETRVLHLLTHTSGLPDMLPDNTRLRQEHRPHAAFVERTCRLAPSFRPGTNVSYQSMGFAIQAEIVHQVSGRLLPEFLRREIFEPLGMRDTALGLDPARRERLALVKVPAEQQGTDWGWSSPYWLGFGAPWGGLITSPADFARFCRMMLNDGALDGARILSPATVRAMTSNQLALLPDVPEIERRCRPWGLGWRLNWPGERASFGDLLPAHVYGHWGATGTLCWLDPVSRAFQILFTTQPLDDNRQPLTRVSNAVAAAVR